MAQPNKINNVKCTVYSGNSQAITFPVSSASWGGLIGVDFAKPTIPTNTLPHVKQIIFSDPMTTVIWADGSEPTRSKCKHGDVFDESVGFALCVTKKLYGRELYNRLMKRAKRQY